MIQNTMKFFYMLIYPDLNLVMNSIRILNDEISSSFRLIYFMTYTV